MIGSAKRRRCSRFRRSRVSLETMGDSGSSRASSRIRSRSSRASPSRRRCHRAGSPPMTADSTISVSHFHGARSEPATIAPPLRLDPRRPPSHPFRGLQRRCRWRFCAPNRPNVSSPGGTKSADGIGSQAAGPGRARGTPRTVAPRASRPRSRAGPGTRAPPGEAARPRSNQTGMPPRRQACSSSPRYVCGDRSSTAISSNGTPRLASSRMRRAISIASRPSPGAENNRTSPCGSRVGGRSLSNR